MYSLLAKIPLLGCIVGKHGVRPDPEKIKAITDWPVPVDVKGLRKFLVLSAYLHKYLRNYAEMTVHLSRLLKKNGKWSWNADCQRSFEGIKQSLMQSPIFAIDGQERSFYVVCDASDFVIGCALMQTAQSVSSAINHVRWKQMSVIIQCMTRNFLP